MKLCHPLKFNAIITQRFGENPGWYPTSQGHNGVDFGVDKVPCYAMRTGKVSVSSEFTQPGVTDGKTGYGRHVRILHDNGVSIYGHLSRRDVEVGDVVIEGQQIGITGGGTDDPNSGWSTGPHLHAEYRINNVANPVPGGYVYNAIDILPLLYIPGTEGETMLFYGKVVVDGLRIRTGASTGAGIIGYARTSDAPYPVYEVSGDWLRIGDGKWFCEKMNGNVYVERITNTEPPVSEPTDKEKLDKLWEVVRAAHPEKF